MTDTTESTKLNVTLAEFGTMLRAAIAEQMPGADINHVDLANIGPAVRRMFQRPELNNTPLKLEATVAFMAFAIVQTIKGKMRGSPECNGSTGYVYGEDEYRAKMVRLPMVEKLGLRIGFNRSLFSQYQRPAVNDMENLVWLNWLLSQYVFTAALYGGITEEDAVEMRGQWSSVQWDWLHCDPYLANKDFKRYWVRKGRT